MDELPGRTCVYSVVLTCLSPTMSQFNSLCNEPTSVWSMFVYNTREEFRKERPINYQSHVLTRPSH